jgi:hypothetical protein
MYDQGGTPTEDFQAIVRILATGYLRYRERVRQQNSLDSAAVTSVHGHEVNGTEKGEPVGNRGTAAA